MCIYIYIYICLSIYGVLYVCGLSLQCAVCMWVSMNDVCCLLVALFM